jgi:hypothetical protein
MKRLLTLSLSVFTVVCLLVATDRHALAYINPGEGMIALQSAAASLATASYFMRRRIASLFSKKPAAEETPMPVVKADSQKA